MWLLSYAFAQDVPSEPTQQAQQVEKLSEFEDLLKALVAEKEVAVANHAADQERLTVDTEARLCCGLTELPPLDVYLAAGAPSSFCLGPGEADPAWDALHQIPMDETPSAAPKEEPAPILIPEP